MENEQPALANAYSTLGDIAKAESDLPLALDHYKQALCLNRSLSHADGIAITSGQLARLQLVLGDTKEALRYAQDCVDENVRSGNEEGEAFAPVDSRRGEACHGGSS